MKKLNARLSVRRETLTRLNQESLAEAAGGTFLPPPSYRICYPSNLLFGCGNPPIVV